MPIPFFYLLALVLPGVVTGAVAVGVRAAWRARASVSPAAKVLMAVWVVVSVATIGIGALAALVVSIARATTPGRADPSRALMIVLVLVVVEVCVGLVLRAVLRRREGRLDPAA